MLRLLFKRYESEPIRESYFRKYVYFLLDQTLYRKRYSWGRIQQNDTTKIILAPAMLQHLMDLLQQDELCNDREEKCRVPNEANLELVYKMDLLKDGKMTNQLYKASESHMLNQFDPIHQLWRQLEQLSQQQAFGFQEEVRRAEGFEFELQIEKVIHSKDTQRDIRSYELKGHTLYASKIKKGRHREHLIKEQRLNDYEIACLYQCFQEEQSHWQKKLMQQETKGNYISPFTKLSLNAQVQGQKQTAMIYGSQAQMFEHLPYLAAEIFENQVINFL